MFGKRAKELQELQTLLTQRNSENELQKKKIAELEEEVARLKEQENLVLRAITEANRTANRIEMEAGQERDRLISEAEKTVRDAEQKADEVLKQADDDADSVRKDADSYSENIRTDANIYVERTIIASQLEVKKRRDVMAEMNRLLKETTEHLNERMSSFRDMLASVIEENEEQADEICAEVEKCSCGCDECKEPCTEHKGAEKKKTKKDSDGDEDEDEDEEEDESDEECEEEPVPETEEEPAEEAPAAFMDNGDTDHDEPEPLPEREIDPASLPHDYKSPAELMKNIYYIQRRDLPEIRNISDFSDRTPAGGLTFRDELGNISELPLDRKANSPEEEEISAS